HPRFAGWWGGDKRTRFRMQPQFQPTAGADGWQLSNPPVLALAPLRVSLQLFREAGLERLRETSVALSGWPGEQVEARLRAGLDRVTPRDARRGGAQLSLRVRAGRDAGRSLFEYLTARGNIGDWREPGVIRISAAPL